MSSPEGLPDLPDLQVVSTDALQPHEWADASRAEPLAARLRADGVLRNPIIVFPAGERQARFVVLDGANRTAALRQMGLPFALVQVVHAGATSVNLRTWNHVILDLPAERLQEAIERSPELALIPSDADRARFNLSAGGTLACLHRRDGRVLEIVAETEPLDWRIRNLNRLVGSYLTLARVERTSAPHGDRLVHLHPDFSGLVVFRPFRVEEVVTSAAAGWLLPAGLTRFVVSPRALRVNYPLEQLSGEASLEARRAGLAAWLQDRLSLRAVRYYAESTFLFDE